MPHGRFVLRAAEPRGASTLEVGQGERVLLRRRVRRLVPNRSVHLPAAWAAAVDPAGGPVTVRLLRRA